MLRRGADPRAVEGVTAARRAAAARTKAHHATRDELLRYYRAKIDEATIAGARGMCGAFTSTAHHIFRCVLLICISFCVSAGLNYAFCVFACRDV